MDMLLLPLLIIILFLILLLNIESKNIIKEKLKNESSKRNSLELELKNLRESLEKNDRDFELQQNIAIHEKQERYLDGKRYKEKVEEYKVKIDKQRELIDKYQKEKRLKPPKENERINENEIELPNQKKIILSKEPIESILKQNEKGIIELSDKILDDLNTLGPGWGFHNNDVFNFENELVKLDNELTKSDNMHTNLDKQEIKDIIKERGIFELVHFTNIDNLKSIIENGFLSIDLQKESGIKGIINDKERFDKKLNTTSFSIEFPNYKFFYSLKQKNINTKWVIITLEPSVLYLHKENIYYCENNAASKEIALKNDEQLKTSISFRDMFKENMYMGYYGNTCRENLDIPKSYSTDPQAEILIEGQIPNTYIRSIYFENSGDYNFVTDKMWDLIKYYNIGINKKLFNPRNDYTHWQRRI